MRNELSEKETIKKTFKIEDKTVGLDGLLYPMGLTKKL
jgi:hypothetical protein